MVDLCHHFIESQDLALIGKVAFAMLLGGMLGLEREFSDKPAGFRTQSLVAGASALLVGLCNALLDSYSGKPPGMVQADPIRIVQAIVVGIGFLGAGTIFEKPRSARVKGLTTAATLLISANIGIAVAIGHAWLAAAVTVLALIVLVGLGTIENLLDRFKKKRSRNTAAVDGEEH